MMMMTMVRVMGKKWWDDSQDDVIDSHEGDEGLW